MANEIVYDLARWRQSCLTDWVTQLWVVATGRKISLAEHRWLSGPIGKTRRIGHNFFIRFTEEKGRPCCVLAQLRHLFDSACLCRRLV